MQRLIASILVLLSLAGHDQAQGDTNMVPAIWPQSPTATPDSSTNSAPVVPPPSAALPETATNAPVTEVTPSAGLSTNNTATNSANTGSPPFNRSGADNPPPKAILQITTAYMVPIYWNGAQVATKQFAPGDILDLKDEMGDYLECNVNGQVYRIPKAMTNWTPALGAQSAKNQGTVAPAITTEPTQPTQANANTDLASGVKDSLPATYAPPSSDKAEQNIRQYFEQFKTFQSENPQGSIRFYKYSVGRACSPDSIRLSLKSLTGRSDFDQSSVVRLEQACNLYDLGAWPQFETAVATSSAKWHFDPK